VLIILTILFFSTFMPNVAAKLNDYWNEKRGGTEKRITPENQ
jgi:hypothetical protein